MTSQPSLRSMIAAGKFIVAPGVYDMISLRIADRMDFDALYMTGYGVSASYLGQPDAGIATYTDMVGRVRQMCEIAGKPLIADADTGYGGAINIRHTVRGYEAAGAAAIQLEDQDMPKKCGHTTGRRIIPMEEMALKIRVAVDSRKSDETLIIARTDARTTHGLDEAIRRGVAYAEAGADIVFIESPESADELRRIGQEIDAPLLANMVPTGRTPEVPAGELKELGFDVAIYPSLAHGVAAEAISRAFRHLLEAGQVEGLPVPLFQAVNKSAMHELMGFPEIWETERKYGLRTD